MTSPRGDAVPPFGASIPASAPAACSWDTELERVEALARDIREVMGAAA